MSIDPSSKALRQTTRKLIEVGFVLTGIFGILSVLGGGAMMFASRDGDHPYVAAGIATVFFSAMFTVVVFVGLYFAKWQIAVSIEAERGADASLVSTGSG
jgi:hypothetical protein